MLDRQLEKLGIRDAAVLEAIRRVPRHEFVPESLRREAYENRPLPIGHDQTISQPLVVAEMTQLVQPRPDAKALDVGTGSGYQAAVLAELVDHVYSIEIIEELADEARERLGRLGYDNVTVRHGNGRLGWPEEAPFDVIVAAAAPINVPQPLVDQLALGGRLAMPIGPANGQQLVLVERTKQGDLRRVNCGAVAFVPMTGGASAKGSED